MTLNDFVLTESPDVKGKLTYQAKRILSIEEYVEAYELIASTHSGQVLGSLDDHDQAAYTSPALNIR